jgi:hypothetical protein
MDVPVTLMDVPMTGMTVPVTWMERFVANLSGIAPNRRVLALFGSETAKNSPDLVLFC